MPSDTLPGEAGRRLHVLSPLLAALSAVWRLVVPAILVLLFARGSNYEALFAIFVFPAIAIATVRFLTFRYWIAEHELIIREGVLTRNERHVPYTRIQTIDTSQNPIHRLLGVAEVRIETAGGQEPEANMKVLSLDAVEELRGHVFRQKRLAAAEQAAERAAAGLEALPGDEPQETAEGAELAEGGAVDRARHQVLALELRDLATYGVISNRGMAIVAAVFGLYWQASYMGLVSWVQLAICIQPSSPEVQGPGTSPM